MISPLGRGHRGGVLSISSGSALDISWDRGGSATAEGRTVGALEPAAAAVEGRMAGALGSATVVAASRVEVSAGERDVLRTRGR